MTDLKKFQELLDDNYDWPSKYLFKFIVPKDQVSLAINILVGAEITKKESRSGKYISISAHLSCNSAQAVIEIYQKMAIIPGVVSL